MNVCVCVCVVVVVVVGVATLKKIELAKKFSVLKRSGKLEKFVEKKRKRNVKRDRKQLPFAR